MFNIVQVGSSDGTGPGMMLGLGNGKSPLNNYSGSTNDGISYDARGRVLKNTIGIAVVPSYTTGDVVGIKADLDAHTVSFNKNGGAWSAALDITSLGSEVYVTCSLGNGTTPSQVQIATEDWNDFPWTTMNVVAHGDSMTLTSGVEQTYHPRLLAMIEASRVGWAQGQHIGINGVAWANAWSDAGYPYNMIQDAPLRVDPLRSPLPNWLILFAGTNGFAIFHEAPATVYQHFTEYLADRLAAGWEPAKIIVCTMLPRLGVSETDRAAYNALLVSGATTYGYQLARLDLDPDMGVAGAYTNTTYFQADGTHPTDAGHDRIAHVIQPLIQ